MDLLLTGMGVVFVGAPPIALLLGAVFAILYFRGRQRTVLAAGLLWTAYGAYETAIKLQFICPEGCNIRVDLLLIYPLLTIVSILALVIFLRR